MRGYKALIVTLGVPVVFVLIGCSGDFHDADHPTPVNVTVERARTPDGTGTIAYSGTIEESETIPLTFAVVGTVARVMVSEGDIVHKGQPLAVLNDESFRSLNTMALATLKQAEDAYARLQPMYKNGNLPEVKFIEVETDLQKARSAAVIAKNNLDDCTLTSPVDGIVGRRSIEPGMTALPNVTSLTIVKIHTVFARVSVSENEISAIQRGQRATIRIAALNDAEFHGRVEEIGVLADPIAHTYRIRIGIANLSLVIKPGMICTVRLAQVGRTQGVMVAGSAVMVDEHHRSFLFVVDSSRGIAVRRYVIPSALLNDGIALQSGARDGDLIVVSGQHKLVDSATVRIVNR